MSSKSKRRQQRRQQAPPLHRPDTREVAVAQVTDKYSEYPSNGLTPVRLAEIFKEADSCQRRDGFVVFRRTENVEKWRVKVYSLCIIILAVFARQA